MSDGLPTNGTRVTNAEIYQELRTLAGQVQGMSIVMEKVLDPTLKNHTLQFEQHRDLHVELDDTLRALNTKFYGILGGALLGGGGLVLKLAGVL